MPLPVCLRQMVAWSDRETAIACLDTALAFVDRPTLLTYFENASDEDRKVAHLCREGSESGPESLVRQRLGAVGIDLIQQVHVADVGRVDAIVDGTRVVIEVDGRQYHVDPESFELDRWRSAELTARGFIVVRLSFRRIVTDWSWCDRMVRAAIEQSKD